MSQVCLAWATKKRHIAIDKKVLCEPVMTISKMETVVKYNSIALSGFPDYYKKHDDSRRTHHDGIIDFKPLNEQSTVIDTSSICNKCLKKYTKILKCI